MKARLFAAADMPGRYRRHLAADSHVYEGYTGDWERKHIEAGIVAMIRKVRDDPSAARKFQEIYTAGCRVRGFYRKRQFLVVRACIPDVLLDHRELSRTDLRL